MKALGSEHAAKVMSMYKDLINGIDVFRAFDKV